MRYWKFYSLLSQFLPFCAPQFILVVLLCITAFISFHDFMGFTVLLFYIMMAELSSWGPMIVKFSKWKTGCSLYNTFKASDSRGYTKSYLLFMYADVSGLKSVMHSYVKRITTLRNLLAHTKDQQHSIICAQDQVLFRTKLNWNNQSRSQ